MNSCKLILFTFVLDSSDEKLSCCVSPPFVTVWPVLLLDGVGAGVDVSILIFTVDRMGISSSEEGLVHFFDGGLKTEKVVRCLRRQFV